MEDKLKMGYKAITNFALLRGPTSRGKFQKIYCIPPPFDDSRGMEKFHIQTLQVSQVSLDLLRLRDSSWRRRLPKMF